MIAGLVVTTLRLYRAQIVVTGLLLAALVALVLTEGLSITSLVSEYRDGNCPPEGCGDLAAQVGPRYHLFGLLLPFLGLLPAAIGAFWGAPLLGREYETGTTKFAWTQSVSRRTWILARMIVLGSLVALGGAVLGIAVDYWLSLFIGLDVPIAVEAAGGFSHLRGVVPIAWWLFGFSLGAASGALLRRTVPAIAVTLIFAAFALIVRNLWLGLASAGQPLSTAPQLRLIETATLLAVTALVTAVTCWSVERARA